MLFCYLNSNIKSYITCNKLIIFSIYLEGKKRNGSAKQTSRFAEVHQWYSQFFLLAAKSSWAHLVFSWQQLVKIPLIFVPSQRIENRWTSDGKRKFSRWFWFKWKMRQNGRFLGLKNKREKAFLPFKTQLFHIQVVRYAAWANNNTQSIYYQHIT